MESIVNISIKEFLRTGQFGPVQLLMSRDQVYHDLGEPDGIGYATRKDRKARKPTALLYGNIELWFAGSQPDQLSAIFSDDFDVLRGNERIQVDSWVLQGTMPFDDMIAALEKEAIPFWMAKPRTSNMRDIVIGPGIVVSFIVDQEPFGSPPGLNCLYFTLTHPYEPLTTSG